MKTEIFSQIGLDSAALGLLGSVVHRFDEPGRYVGVTMVGDASQSDYDLVVEADAPPAVQIDLAAIGRRGSKGDCCSEGSDRPTFRVAPGGYVSFFVGRGRERWATVVGDPAQRTPAFDSRALGSGDLFAGTVLRPGVYRVTNILGSGSTELVVRPVKSGSEPYRPANAVRTKMGATAGRKSVQLGQAQGVIFEASTNARIVIELVDPFGD
jgi:hypothetical protein